jgi:hypothetical protein
MGPYARTLSLTIRGFHRDALVLRAVSWYPPQYVKGKSIFHDQCQCNVSPYPGGISMGWGRGTGIDGTSGVARANTPTKNGTSVCPFAVTGSAPPRSSADTAIADTLSRPAIHLVLSDVMRNMVDDRIDLAIRVGPVGRDCQACDWHGSRVRGVPLLFPTTRDSQVARRARRSQLPSLWRVDGSSELALRGTRLFGLEFWPVLGLARSPESPLQANSNTPM